MHLFKHYLITAKDFLPDIDNTIEESIFKGVDSLILTCVVRQSVVIQIRRLVCLTKCRLMLSGVFYEISKKMQIRRIYI